jgi:hypothetical protein
MTPPTRPHGDPRDASGAAIAVTDFVQLAGPVPEEVGFECSSTVGGVSGGLCVTDDALLLTGGGTDDTARIVSRDIRAWRTTPTGATFSLAVEDGARHTVTLLAQFQTATVQAMTRAAGPSSGLAA